MRVMIIRVIMAPVVGVTVRSRIRHKKCPQVRSNQEESEVFSSSEAIVHALSTTKVIEIRVTIDLEA